MKKGLSLLFISSLLMVGCGPNSNPSPYMEIGNLGWRSNYVKGEEINLQGLVAKYYSDVGAEADIASVTKEMISDFDTTTAGEKYLKVTYRGFSKTIKYEVFDFDNARYSFINNYIYGVNKIWHYNSTTKTISNRTYDSYIQIRDNFDVPKTKQEASYTLSVNKDKDPAFRFYFGDEELEFTCYDNSFKLYGYQMNNKTRREVRSETASSVIGYDKDSVIKPTAGVLYNSNKSDKDYGDEKKYKFAAFTVDSNLNVNVYLEEYKIIDISTLTPIFSFSGMDSYLANDNSVNFENTTVLTDGARLESVTIDNKTTYRLVIFNRLSIGELDIAA